MGDNRGVSLITGLENRLDWIIDSGNGEMDYVLWNVYAATAEGTILHCILVSFICQTSEKSPISQIGLLAMYIQNVSIKAY